MRRRSDCWGETTDALRARRVLIEDLEESNGFARRVSLQQHEPNKRPTFTVKNKTNSCTRRFPTIMVVTKTMMLPTAAILLCLALVMDVAIAARGTTGSPVIAFRQAVRGGSQLRQAPLRHRRLPHLMREFLHKRRRRCYIYCCSRR